MLQLAREAAIGIASVVGITAAFGSSMIVDEASLATAAKAVAALSPELQVMLPSGVIVAAFGDPGRAYLAASMGCPVTGIAEAGMAEASQGGARFAVVTTTPALMASITSMAHHYGHGSQFVGVQLTTGDPVELMGNADRLDDQLARACQSAIRDGADRIVIGGGPLASAARRLKSRLSIELVEPVPAAVRLAIARAVPSR